MGERTQSMENELLNNWFSELHVSWSVWSSIVKRYSSSNNNNKQKHNRSSVFCYQLNMDLFCDCRFCAWLINGDI